MISQLLYLESDQDKQMVWIWWGKTFF